MIQRFRWLNSSVYINLYGGITTTSQLHYYFTGLSLSKMQHTCDDILVAAKRHLDITPAALEIYMLHFLNKSKVFLT